MSGRGMWSWEVRVLLAGTYNHHRDRSLTTGTDIQEKHQRGPWETTKTPAEMLAIRCSGEIQTRKDDSCRGRAIKSLFWQITTNQRQHSSPCYRHTLPYRYQRSEVGIGAGPDHGCILGFFLLPYLVCPYMDSLVWKTSRQCYIKELFFECCVKRRVYWFSRAVSATNYYIRRRGPDFKNTIRIIGQLREFDRTKESFEAYIERLENFMKPNGVKSGGSKTQVTGHRSGH